MARRTIKPFIVETRSGRTSRPSINGWAKAFADEIRIEAVAAVSEPLPNTAITKVDSAASGRVLPNLLEQIHDPVQERLAADSARPARGRKSSAAKLEADTPEVPVFRKRRQEPASTSSAAPIPALSALGNHPVVPAVVATEFVARSTRGEPGAKWKRRLRHLRP